MPDEDGKNASTRPRDDPADMTIKSLARQFKEEFKSVDERERRKHREFHDDMEHQSGVPGNIKLEANTLSRVYALAFHKVKPWVCAALCGELQIWDYQEGKMVKRHTDVEHVKVRTVDFHPESNINTGSTPLLASGDDNYKIKVWGYCDMVELNCLFELLGHLDWIRSVQFHPNAGKWILSASDDQTVRIWDVAKRACLKILTGHNQYVLCAAFTEDNVFVSASRDRTIRIWDATKLSRKPQQQTPGEAVQAELFGKYDVTVKHVLKGHEQGANCFDFHRTLPILASADDGGGLILWRRRTETKDWQTLMLYGHANSIRSCLFHPQHDLLYWLSCDGNLRLWDFSTARCLHSFRAHGVDQHPPADPVLAGHASQDLVAVGHDRGFTLFESKLERRSFAIYPWNCIARSDVKSLLGLITEVYKTDTILLTEFVALGAIHYIITAVRNKEVDTEMAQRALDILGSIAEELRTLISKQDGISCIAWTMQQHPTSPQVICAGLLGYLGIMRNASDACTLDATFDDIILWAMRQHPGNAAVQEHGCAIMRILAQRTEGIAEKGGIEVTLSAMRQHDGSASIQAAGCETLVVFARRLEGRIEIAKAGGIDVILRGMHRHAGNWTLQESGCRALRNIAASTNLRAEIGQKAGVQTTLSAMRRHEETAGVQEAGCILLLNLSLDDKMRDAIELSGGVGTIRAAMKNHKTNDGVTSYGRKALQSLGVDGSCCVM